MVNFNLVPYIGSLTSFIIVLILVLINLYMVYKLFKLPHIKDIYHSSLEHDNLVNPPILYILGFMIVMVIVEITIILAIDVILAYFF